MNSNSEGHEFETHIVDWMNKENNVNEVEKVSIKFRQLAVLSLLKAKALSHLRIY